MLRQRTAFPALVAPCSRERFEERIAGIVRTKSGSDSDSSCGSSSSIMSSL